MPNLLPSTRLYVLIARRAEVAVIFRGGPAKQVLLVRWDLSNDTFEAGQWFKGRVYERSCDLSPTGDRLIYFAGQYRAPLYTWTAVSRPPFFTAVALWEGMGCWGGGGLFAGEHEIRLHWDARELLSNEASIPKRLIVSRIPESRIMEPIFEDRMVRDGWTLTQAATWHADRKAWRRANPPEIWTKPHPRRPRTWLLQMRTVAKLERQGPPLTTEYAVVDKAGAILTDLGRTDWADWQSSGDLLYARKGKIFRDRMQSPHDIVATARPLVDLSMLRFEPREPVLDALQWSGPRPVGVPVR
jgi:hypothetical protein